MPIAFDASSAGSITTGNSISYSHTCSGSDRLLIVGISAADDDQRTISSMTYGGVAMTRAIRRVSTAGFDDHWIELWYLVNPATGSNTVSISLSGTVDRAAYSNALSLTGVDQTTPLDATNSAIGDSASPSVNVTTTVDNAWAVDYAISDDSGTGSSPGAGQTSFQNYNDTSDDHLTRGSYEGPRATPGSITMSWSGFPDDDWTMIAAAFRPTASSPQSLTLPHIASNSAFFSFSFTHVATIPFLSSASALYSPSIAVGSVSLPLPHISATNSLYNLIVVPGSVNITAPFIASIAELHAFSTLVVSNTSLPEIASVAQLYSPSVAVGAATLSLPQIPQVSPQLYAPIFAAGAWSVGLPFISSDNILYSPVFTRQLEPNELLLLGVG